MEIVPWVLAALAGAGVVWFGSGLLESASGRLARWYRLPEAVEGAVVVAVGSSFPELSTVVVSTLVHGEFELGVAAIVGSALFNVLVIPALAGLTSRERLAASRDLVYKEAEFYMIAVAVLTLAFAFAAIYEPVTDGGGIKGHLTRPLAALPAAVYALYAFTQYQDARDYQSDSDVSGIRPLREWLKLAGSLLVIVVGVEGLVRAAIHFGEAFHTPSFLWGFTVVAAGTSVPDAFVSVRAARAGHAVTSIANVLGSNVFDLLICIPAGVLIGGATVVDFSVTAPLMGVLTAATVLLFLLMRTNMLLGRRECVALLAVYLGIVVWMGLETFALVDLVPDLPPRSGPEAG